MIRVINTQFRIKNHFKIINLYSIFSDFSFNQNQHTRLFVEIRIRIRFWIRFLLEVRIIFSIFDCFFCSDQDHVFSDPDLVLDPADSRGSYTDPVNLSPDPQQLWLLSTFYCKEFDIIPHAAVEATSGPRRSA